MEKTSTGIEANIAGLLCYVLGWVSGLVFFLLEKDSKFVRFHAVQSMIVFGILTLAWIVFRWIPLISLVILPIIWVLWVVLLIVLMIKAYQGERFKLPWAGNIAEKQIS